MTYAMPEAEPWQIVVFVVALAGILTAGVFIARPKKGNTITTRTCGGA